jgi:hypothetical protein
LLALTIAMPLSAQERCRPTDTPRECFERWVPASVTAPEAPAAETVKTLLASVNDGTSDLNAPVHATLKNFLAGLTGSLDTAVVGEDATGLAFGYTPPLNLGGHVRLETKFTKPQLSAQALATVTNPAEQKELEASLTALDDVMYALSYDWTTRLFGRSVERHRPLLAALIPPPADAQSAFVQALAASGIAPADAQKSFRQLNVAAQAFENAVRGTPTQIEQDFASLLNNQPQVYVTGYYNARRDIVGPATLGGELTLELSGRNLNGFYRNEGRGCGTACAAALHAYLLRIRDPRNAPRIALSAAYTRTESLDPAAPDDVTSVVWSLSAGIPFASLISGREGRLEAGVKYDGKSTKGELFQTSLRTDGIFDGPGGVLPSTRERSVAALTFTQSLSDRVSVPVSFVYREVDVPLVFDELQFVVRERESAVHVGLRYRIGPPRPAPRCCC